MKRNLIKPVLIALVVSVVNVLFSATTATTRPDGVADLTAAAFADYANGNYTSVQGGALYVAGTTEGLALPETDLAGHPRVQHKGHIDIGCYECVPKSGLVLILK